MMMVATTQCIFLSTITEKCKILSDAQGQITPCSLNRSHNQGPVDQN